jgi:hypothetical protein
MINSSNAGKVAQSVSLLREAQLITKPSPREIEKYDQQRSDSLLPSSQQLQMILASKTSRENVKEKEENIGVA